MANVKIPAPNGIQTHKGIVYEVQLREMTLDDYLEIGDIHTLARTPEGAVMYIENNANVRAYFERLLVSPTDPLAVGQASLDVGIAIKDAIAGFFLRARSAGARSTTSDETSGQQAGSQPQN